MVYSDKIKYYKALNEPIETGDIYKPFSKNVGVDEALVVYKEGRHVMCNYKDRYVKKTMGAWNRWGVRFKVKPKTLISACKEKRCRNKATDNGYCFKHG